MPRRPASAAKSSRPSRDHVTVARVRAVRDKMWRDAGKSVEGLIALASKEAERLSAVPRAKKKRGRAA